MRTDDQSTAEYAREEFVQLLTGEQTRLFGYIVTLLGDVNDANNVVQQVNMVLWRKAEEFQPGTNFHMWAKKTAYNQTLAFLRDRKRDKLIFDDDVLEQLASRPDDVVEDERRVALRHCLGGISGDSLDLLQLRYAPGKPISEIARLRRKTEGAVKMALMRIRQTLVHCIQGQLESNP